MDCGSKVDHRHSRLIKVGIGSLEGLLRLRYGILLLSLTRLASAQIGGFGSNTIGGGGVREARIGRGGEGIRPFASISEAYDTAAGNPTSLNGNFETQPSYGVEAGFGAYGTKSWRRTAIGLNYRGDYVHYAKTSFQNGSNQILSLALTHQFDKKWSAQIDVAAGSTNRIFGALQSYIPFDANFNSTPTNEVLNSRTNYGQVGAHATYDANRRFGIRFGGTTITTRRATKGLAELQGYSTDAEVFRVLSRSTRITGGYQFNHYHFLGSFGASDIHSVSLKLDRRINRDWRATVGVQAYRVESLGAVVVSLAPEIAALFGRSQGLEAFYRIDKIPGYKAALNYKKKQVFLDFSGELTVAPGNGIFLTSKQTNVSTSLSYTAEKVWNIGINSGYTRYNSITRNLEPYNAFLIGGGVTRKMPWLGSHIFLRADARKFDQANLTTIKQSGYRISGGIGFSPRAVPLSLW